jgi:hypothetical protein
LTPPARDVDAGALASSEDRAAGGPEEEIEVTPEMIEAGISVLPDWSDFFSLGPTGERLLVSRILEASLRVAFLRPPKY